MFNLQKLKDYILKRLPRRRHLRGSILHRAVGDRLFCNDYWKMTRHTVAAGMAIGIIVAFTPTIGFHMVLAGTIAYFLRVNIPVALLACWVVNPVTAPVIYPLQYKLGMWILSVFNSGVTFTQSGVFGKLVRYAWPLWIGSLVSGIILAVIAYATVFFSWGWIMKLKDRVDKRLHSIHDEIENKFHKD